MGCGILWPCGLRRRPHGAPLAGRARGGLWHFNAEGLGQFAAVVLEEIDRLVPSKISWFNGDDSHPRGIVGINVRLRHAQHLYTGLAHIEDTGGGGGGAGVARPAPCWRAPTTTRW